MFIAPKHEEPTNFKEFKELEEKIDLLGESLNILIDDVNFVNFKNFFLKV